MRKLLLFFIPLILIGLFVSKHISDKNTGAPPYQLSGDPDVNMNDYSWLEDWKRPEGPAKVALQVGHWKNEQVPDELHRLRGNTGATGGGKSEWEVNYEIAQLTAEILRSKGVQVEILPATVPPKFWADVFVAIHADGNVESSKTGFKAATPRRDMTGKADKLLSIIEENYQEATGLVKDPNVTRNMRGYYAFGWWRYEHAVHPMTTSLILETGFLSNISDRKIIVDQPETSAKGLATGIIEFLATEKLI